MHVDKNFVLVLFVWFFLFVFCQNMYLKIGI